MTAFANAIQSLSVDCLATATDVLAAVSPALGVVFAVAVAGMVLSAIRRFLP